MGQPLEVRSRKVPFHVGFRRGLTLLVMIFSLRPHLAEAQDSNVLRWRPWEQELLSTTDYTASGGNPYRDLALAVQYWRLPAGTTTCGSPVPGGDSFTGYGFWEGARKDTTVTPPRWVAAPKRFLIRSAFPDGTWCWKTTCSRALPDASPSSTPDCASDTGLSRTGKVTIGKVTSASRLYALGLPKVGTDKRSLVYGDGATPVLWLGDTAWDAPAKYGDGSGWRSFVSDRVTKGFRTVLVAPATQTFTTAPSPNLGFQNARADCSAADLSVVPNRCTTWDAKYWESFDDLVLAANSTGIGMIVIVAGVMDPTVRGGSNNGQNRLFPASPEAKVFARNLAARLAGHFVIFSPSYDAKADDTTPANKSVDGKAVLDLARIVGPAIKLAAPRHLVGLHLSGSSSLASYLDVQADPWLDFQIFQSGHGGSKAGDGTCGFPSGDLGQFERSVCRAREGALELRCFRASTDTPLPDCAAGIDGYTMDRIGKVKPAVNVEGEYENGHRLVSNPDGTKTLVRDWSQLNPSRARSRHTAWATALSGSFGFNIGNWFDLTGWLTPAAALDNQRIDGIVGPYKSDNDLGQMSKILGQSPWSQWEPNHLLVPYNLIKPVGNTPGTPEELKQHLGIAGKVVLLHVPGVQPATQPRPVVKLSKAGKLMNLNHTNVSAVWIDPRGTTRNPLANTQGKCDDSAAGLLTCTVAPGLNLSCSDGQRGCDWILQILSDAIASTNAPNVSGGLSVASATKTVALDTDLQVWTQVDGDSLGVSVWAQLLDASGEFLGEPFVVHPPASKMRALPTPTRDANGNFLVVWEEEGDDATDDVVGVQVSAEGVVLSEPFVVSSSTEDQNGEPAVTSDNAGNSIVTWTRYPLDGSLGDIWLQVYGPVGSPAGDVIQVTGDPGNQSASQVQADGAGGVVVAWTSDPPATPKAATAKRAPSQGVYFRKLWTNGRPRGEDHAIQKRGSGHDRLIGLNVQRDGAFRILWERTDGGSGHREVLEQDFDGEGNPKSGAKRRGVS
jgi:hypothetical protein